jgi:hypothetical protein
MGRDEIGDTVQAVTQHTGCDTHRGRNGRREVCTLEVCSALHTCVSTLRCVTGVDAGCLIPIS